MHAVGDATVKRVVVSAGARPGETDGPCEFAGRMISGHRVAQWRGRERRSQEAENGCRLLSGGGQGRAIDDARSALAWRARGAPATLDWSVCVQRQQATTG